MDEFKFVLRCLLFTVLLVFVSQYKLNNETLEAKAQYALVDSPSAESLRQVAAGGAKFVRTSIEDGIALIKNKMAHNDGGDRYEPAKNH